MRWACCSCGYVLIANRFLRAWAGEIRLAAQTSGTWRSHASRPLMAKRSKCLRCQGCPQMFFRVIGMSTFCSRFL